MISAVAATWSGVARPRRARASGVPATSASSRQAARRPRVDVDDRAAIRQRARAPVGAVSTPNPPAHHRLRALMSAPLAISRSTSSRLPEPTAA